MYLSQQNPTITAYNRKGKKKKIKLFSLGISKSYSTRCAVIIFGRFIYLFFRCKSSILICAKTCNLLFHMCEP